MQAGLYHCYYSVEGAKQILSVFTFRLLLYTCAFIVKLRFVSVAMRCIRFALFGTVKLELHLDVVCATENEGVVTWYVIVT